jgi:hypothetical protein
MDTMKNDIRELSINELDDVCGGRINTAAGPPYFPVGPNPATFQVPNGSPLYGNSSFHDTIDNNNNLP